MDLLNYVGYLKRGKNRNKVFLAIDKPMIPSEITRKVFGKSSNTFFNLVSRALSELNEKKLVEIVNPNEAMGRIYQKTKLGKRVERELIKTIS